MSGYRILDTYTSYKIKERKWTQWLVETAEKAGHRIRDTISAHQNNRKNIGRGTLSASHTVSIKDLASLARSIVTGDPPQPVPEAIRQLLQDVISQRKEASVFYRSRNAAEAIAKSNEGHVYYVNVLEEVLRTLNKAKFEPKPSTSSKNTTNGEDNVKLNNVFEILALEDVNLKDNIVEREAEYEQENPSGKENVKDLKPRKLVKKSRKQISKAKKTSKPKSDIQVSTTSNPIIDTDIFSPKNDYEIIEDEEEEWIFILYCFFKDFNNIREWVQERWCDYDDGLASLVEVSVATNTAFDILQKSEQMLLKFDPGFEFEDVLNVLFLEGGLAHALNHEFSSGEDMGDTLAEEWDYLCLDTHTHLKHWLDFTPPGKVPTGNWHATGPNEPDGPNYLAHTPEEKRKRDEGIIFEFLAECCLIKAFERREDFCLPAEDELTRGAIKMLHTRKIPLWLVFAFKIYLDIRGILESEVAKCREDLLTVGERSKPRLQGYLDYLEHVGQDPSSFIQDRIAEIDCWITKDWAGNDRTRVHVQHGESADDVEPFFFFRRNPILCGLIAFANKLTMNEIGLQAANEWGAIIGATHIYNAVRQEIPSFPKWQDMEALVLIHGQERIFWDGIPLSPADYVKSHDISTGVGDMIARLKRASGENCEIIRPHNVNRRGLAPVSVVSWLFHERYCFGWKGLDSAIKTLPNVEKVLNAIAQNDIQSQLEGFRQLALPSTVIDESKKRAIADREQISNSINSKLTRQFQKTRALTSVQLLDALWRRTSQESTTLAFNYFSMHERCTRLLRSINEEFTEEIKEVIGFETKEDEGQLPIVPYCIFKMMQEKGRWRCKSQITERLAGMVKTIVEEEGNNEILAVRQAIGN